MFLQTLLQTIVRSNSVKILQITNFLDSGQLNYLIVADVQVLDSLEASKRVAIEGFDFVVSEKIEISKFEKYFASIFKLATNYDTLDLPKQKRNFIFESDFRMRLQQGNIVTLQINRVQIRYIFQGEERNLKIINFVGSFNQFIVIN